MNRVAGRDELRWSGKAPQETPSSERKKMSLREREEWHHQMARAWPTGQAKHEGFPQSPGAM